MGSGATPLVDWSMVRFVGWTEGISLGGGAFTVW